ncbi:MAG: glycoside hydrolase [Burkholderiales bacterium]|nr:glycoside hydrolase [Burkholderiales bacterium]
MAGRTDIDSKVVGECRRRAIELLLRNASAEGILAATPRKQAVDRGYAAIFGRDAAVCGIGMALSGHAQLEREAATGLLTLAEHQAANGQIPKFVDARSAEADFWYVGCIDATLWWLIAIATLDWLDAGRRLRRRLAARIKRAIVWLHCQEHQRFFLLQQNEASDWADIMPRSGFVLYSNALWLWVKRLYRLPHAEDTQGNANHLFHPFGTTLAEYRRARLLAHYARDRAHNRELFLSFVNFAFFGDEGDTFGNVLAILCGLSSRAQSQRIVRALEQAGVNATYPVRVLCDPVPEQSFLWRPYMMRHRQNLPWQYHNGGIWPFVGGFWVCALVMLGQREAAARELEKLAHANRLADWGFTEWLHGQTFEPAGMQGQSWNAAAFLMAQHAVAGGAELFPSGTS